MLPLPETGAGFIPTLLKEGLDRGEDGAQKAPRHIQLRKRRHIEHYEPEKAVAILHNENRGEERL